MQTRIIGATFVAVLAGARPVARARSIRPRRKADMVQAPRFEVDPMWPKPLPNNWVLGQAIGVGVDARITSGSCIASTR